jgi:hypothetical protein
MEGYDIYVRPEDPAKNYLLVDDLSQDAVKRMQADGYTPNAVWETSKGSYQAVFVLISQTRTCGYHDPRRKAEKDTLMALQKNLTCTYGGDDKNLAINKDLRLAGFCNKKTGRGNYFMRVYSSRGGECEKLKRLLSERMEEFVELASTQETERRGVTARGGAAYEVDRNRTHGTSPQARTVYNRLQKKWDGLVRKKRWPADPSAIDFRIARDMLSGGWHPDSIADCIRTLSPEFPRRHGNPDQYITKTIRAAQESIIKDEERRHISRKNTSASSPSPQ